MKASCCFVSFCFLVSFFCFNVLGALSTQDALSNLSDEQKTTFLIEKKLLKVAKKKKSLGFPSFINDLVKSEINAEIKRISPNILIEGLYLTPKRNSLNMLYFYNSLLKIKACKKVTYFNEEKKLTHPLFGFSYVIDDQESKTELPDPAAKNLDSFRELLVYQNFLPESPVVSRYSYTSEVGQIRFKAITLDPVKLQGMTGIKSGNLILRIIIQETEEDFIVYTLAYARVNSFFGIAERLFAYRIKGLFNWYYETYLDLEKI